MGTQHQPSLGHMHHPQVMSPHLATFCVSASIATRPNHTALITWVVNQFLLVAMAFLIMIGPEVDTNTITLGFFVDFLVCGLPRESVQFKAGTTTPQLSGQTPGLILAVISQSYIGVETLLAVAALMNLQVFSAGFALGAGLRSLKCSARLSDRQHFCGQSSRHFADLANSHDSAFQFVF